MDKNFGFDDKTFLSGKKLPPGCNTYYSTFQCDKPYRLAFYVKPGVRKTRFDLTRNVNTTINQSNASVSVSRNSSMPVSRDSSVSVGQNASVTQNVTINKTPEVIKPATKRKNNGKKVNDKENKGNNKSRNNTTAKKKKEETKAALFDNDSSTSSQTRQSGRLKELNFKKSPNNAVPEKEQNEPEVSKDETMEVKKKRYSATYSKKAAAPKPKEPARSKQKEPARTKQKPTTKQRTRAPDPDFEKWAENINKEFDEVDNFNISVSYD